ncbi:MAG: phosphotransferase [Roseibium sp.]|uniref:PHP domain-containing protein n=1 Tax=Roseibium sp. TaxID=1936156 RepID=UPI003D9C2B7C
MLDAFSAPGRFFKGNLHGHSTNSDGDLSPERHCKFYQDAGYDFVCLSDHFREVYGFPVTDTSAYRNAGFTTILGAELHSGNIGNGEIWHILAVGLPPDFAPTDAGESGPQLAQRALDAGAFVAIPHPDWYGLTLDDGLSLPEGVHAVEVHNSICTATGRGEGGYLLDQMLTAGRKLGAIAVDDVHRYQRDALGGWVNVKAEAGSPDALLDALKRGAYYASTGAEILHLERNGDWIHVETSPVDSVWLLGRGAKSTHVFGEGIARAKLPLEPFVGGWARLVIRATDGARAWTNPIWLD